LYSKLLMAIACLLVVASCGDGGSDTPAGGRPEDAAGAPPVPPPAQRQFEDQPDLFAEEYQVHVIYAVPTDGQDNQFDVNGVLADTVTIANDFFRQASGGKEIRFDRTIDGALDISFLALPNPGADYADEGVFAREAIQADVQATGYLDPRKIYLVYYDGRFDLRCGGAGPPIGSGDPVAVMYLQGRNCRNQYQFARGAERAGFWEWAAAHEVVHALGFVRPCSPNHNDSAVAHTGDVPGDLMYAGPQSWAPALVDPGQDDYYGASVPAECEYNLFLSAFLEPRDGDQLPENFLR
jgi:hypothetical protein